MILRMETVVDLLSSNPKTATEIYTESGKKSIPVRELN
jgi:hypothetical protein